MLTLRQFATAFGGLLGSHAEGNRAGIFIAVGGHVISFINRVMRMQPISGGKSAIAFFQPSDSISRGNGRLIRMIWLSRSGKLACGE